MQIKVDVGAIIEVSQPTVKSGKFSHKLKEQITI